MKVVINSYYGGFGVSEQYREQYNAEHGTELYNFQFSALRTNEEFIDAVENSPELVNDGYNCLKVVEIPDEATDWEITNSDGWETVIYVVDGKLFHIY